MNVLNTKRSVFHMALLLVVIALALSACGSDDGEELTYPVIRLQVNNQTYNQPVYQYYWPRTADDVAYDVDYDAYNSETIQAAPIAKGDTVQFTLDGVETAPTSFTATLLDGTNTIQDLNLSNGVFSAEYPDGAYNVQVDALYADIKGHEAYVSYVFGLAVAGVVPPTPTPTVTPTITPTPTLTPTLIPTSTSTPLPTATPTVPPTATTTPTEPPTLAPTLTPVEPTATATVMATATAEAVTGDLGEQTITGTVRLSMNGALVTVAGASVSYTHISTEDPSRDSNGTTTTNANGEYEIGPLEMYATDLVIIEAMAPGYQTQVIEHTGGNIVDAENVLDFMLLPTEEAATSTPVPTKTPVVVAPTAVPVPSNVPMLKLSFAGKQYIPVGYKFCERGDSGERICTELPMEDASPTRIQLLRGAAAQLSIDAPRPDSVRIEYLSDAGEATGQPETRPGDTLILLTITPERGSYIMTVRVSWADTDATYYFRVSVSG